MVRLCYMLCDMVMQKYRLYVSSYANNFEFSIGGVMVSVLASSAVDRGFESNQRLKN
jgi:hypothetical protein